MLLLLPFVDVGTVTAIVLTVYLWSGLGLNSSGELISLTCALFWDDCDCVFVGMPRIDGVDATGTVRPKSPSDVELCGSRGCLCCTLSSGEGMIVHTLDVFTNERMGTSKSAMDLVSGRCLRERRVLLLVLLLLLLSLDVSVAFVAVLLDLVFSDAVVDVATAAHVERCCDRRRERLLNMGEGVVLSSKRNVMGSLCHRNFMGVALPVSGCFACLGVVLGVMLLSSSSSSSVNPGSTMTSSSLLLALLWSLSWWWLLLE